MRWRLVVMNYEKINKREPYLEADTGCFQPFRRVDMGTVGAPYGERNYALTMVFDK